MARGRAELPDAVVEAEPGALAQVIWHGRDLGAAIRAGEVAVSGREPRVRRFLTLFPLPPTLPPTHALAMASYTVNDRAVARAQELIRARQYVLDSDWGDVQPNAAAENAFLEAHSWDEYAAWHLGLTEGATDETKARYAFVYGDFRRIHRSGLIACQYRAAEWRHKAVELAAHELLQLLDETSGYARPGAISERIALVQASSVPA